jgi:two-component system, chemotaxis family, response regulator Rcp1
MTQRAIEILLVDDSPGDVWLTRETLLQGAASKNISVADDGEKAIEFLRRRGAYANAPRPDVILLDLNLPRLNGLEVLREVKNDPELASITVVVLTSSEAPADVNAAYDLNANCYVVKPADLERFTMAIRGIEQFWMSFASLPTMHPAPSAKNDSTEAADDKIARAGDSSCASYDKASFAERGRGVGLRTGCTEPAFSASGRAHRIRPGSAAIRRAAHAGGQGAAPGRRLHSRRILESRL